MTLVSLCVRLYVCARVYINKEVETKYLLCKINTLPSLGYGFNLNVCLCEREGDVRKDFDE